MNKQLNQAEALRALANGQEIQYLDTNGIYRDMDKENFNPIRRPSLTWRIKLEPAQEAFYNWCDNNGPDVGEEEGFHAGWKAAMEYAESKKALTGSDDVTPERYRADLSPHNKDDPLNWNIRAPVRNNK
ncbi:hypothetical protein [Alteromonas sp. BMJM2]|uniref:hypothetical protein n=1 Tax=Alteromonas sp. BMJM2 TaxID=2954241 RepID=UPI0022B4B726|nr:hypothetical protein [Alteromonas sp. BMJM2]